MRQWTVDAFADRAFRGNPACVVEPFDTWPDAGWMQSLAQENNQAETAFLRRTSDAARFDLRWFTPGMEVDLCGHATLAAGHVLAAELGLTAPVLTFDTRSGPLTVVRSDDGYELDLPASVSTRTTTPDLIAALSHALGAAPLEVWTSRYLVAILKDAATVRTLTPDIRAIAALQSEAGEPGQVVVAALSDDPAHDVVDRFFAPGCGVDEDPATGSAHAILGPLYAEKLERPVVRFFQAFPGRGGPMETEVRGDRVLIRGQAVTVMESVLRIPA